MAPPRTTKKSTLTSPSTATTRQGARHPRKQVTNEADDLEDLDQGHSAIDDEHAGDDEAEVVQRTSDGPLEQMMVKMVDDKEELEESINAVFEIHEAEASAAHQAQLKRLQDLLGQKINIEAAMGRQLASLQKIHNAHSRDLETVVERRLREMK
ncbi:hypothetical protein J4E80_005142 [Alternaria sp. BMP 0032]|nr:hypothetical protein J4E80_005142 [Alternaria sp. BMP 0032]